MHLLRRSSRSGSRSSEIEKRRWGVAGFVRYFTKNGKLVLSPPEVGRLFDTFEEATRGDLQRKANVCVFVATFKRKCIEGKDLTFTNMLAVSKELDKLIELEECVTWPVMTEKIENHTRLRLMVNRPEVERRITSVAKVSTQSSAPRNEYQSLLERSGTWEPPKHSPVTSSSWLCDLRSLSAQALERRTILTPTVDTCSVTTIARIHNLMEKAAASPAIPKDDMLATTDEEEEEEETENMELVVQEDAAADKISSGIAQRLVVLSQEQREEARRWLAGPADEKVLTEKYAIPITRSKLSALRPNTWLNDEIINFYMGLLQDRDAELCKNNPSRNSSHYFNSFFMNKVLDENDKRVYTYSAVRRWTKKFDIFTKRRIYFPINISNTHWTHLVLYIEAREIHYYDSMGGNGEKYMRAILKWVVDEARDKKKAIDGYDVSDFRLIDHGHNIPQQENGYDCGVFSCMFADFDTDDLPFQFSQENLADFRLKIVLAIMRGELLYL